MKYITIAILVLFLLAPSTLACKMWGMTAETLPEAEVKDQLVIDSQSLKSLSRYSNTDGWGLVYYNNGIVVHRGQPSAYLDSNYNIRANELAESGKSVALGHVRQRSSGATAIPNPHPFVRGDWSFCHNGGLSKNLLKELIGTALSDYTPTVGNNWDDTDVVDSDLYMVYILVNIVQNDGDVLSGIRDVAKNLPSGQANFLLSNGEHIWAFKKGLPLSYTDTGLYSAVATTPINTWTEMSDYNVVEMTPGEDIILYENIREYEAPITPDIPGFEIIFVLVAIVSFINIEKHRKQ